MLVEFSIVPIGTPGTGLGDYVAEIIDLVDRRGLPYQLGPMGTVVEGGWDDLMDLVKECHERMRCHTGRVLTRIVIDDREGAGDRITGKVESVMEKRSTGRSRSVAQ